MSETFKTIANSVKYVRVQRNINQDTAAEESGVSLRSIQKIEAGNPVKSELLLQYLDYLDLLNPMIETLPDPDQRTPMELLKAAPKRRERARTKGGTTKALNSTSDFKWGDGK